MKTNYFQHKFCCVWPSKQTYRATVFHCLWPGNCTRLLSGNVDIDHGSRAGWDGSCGLRPLLSLALALRVQSASVTHFFYLCFREYLQMSIELVVVAVAAVCCYLCCCLFYSCCFCVLCRCYGSARFPAFPPFVLMASPPFYLLLLLSISLSLSLGVLLGPFSENSFTGNNSGSSNKNRNNSNNNTDNDNLHLQKQELLTNCPRGMKPVLQFLLLFLSLLLLLLCLFCCEICHNIYFNNFCPCNGKTFLNNNKAAQWGTHTNERRRRIRCCAT